jgi:para-nitrobenzyl esterase
MSVLATLLSRSSPILLAAIALTSLVACGVGADDRPRVDTLHGPVLGVERDGMQSFFAIPYAAPPTGERRWRPPAAAATWTLPRFSEASAAPCLQTGMSPFRLSNDSEDCLYLDVHRPASSDAALPVMVWIHGGAFNTGGSVTFADPSPLVNQGVIVVNIAYRLGAMGFLGHPALDVNGQVGNYGIMDQQAALRWVRDNIAAFGGNPGNVTIWGESAGGFSVMTHLASPGSAGLFHRAIVMSGNYTDAQLTATALRARSTTIVDNALTAAGITCPGGTVTAQCLRDLPDAVVRNQLAVAFNQNMSSPVPAVDGTVLPKSIRQTFVDNENHRVPVINGTTLDEWSLFLAIRELTQPPLENTQAAFAAYVRATFGSAVEPAAAAYPITSFENNASLAATALGTDLVFACRALRATQRMVAQTPGQIFMYEFRDRTAIPLIQARADGSPISFAQGAGHAVEVQYLFNQRLLANDEQRALQTAMATYWANFARHGDPNQGRAVPAPWPQFSGAGASTVLGLDVTSRGGIAPLAESFETAHRCDTVWSAIAF